MQTDIEFDAQVISRIAGLMDEYRLQELTFNRVDDHLKVKGSFYHKLTVRATPKYAEGF